MIKILSSLEEIADEIDEENNKVISKMKEAQPFLIDVQVAKKVIPELNADNHKTLLHAGQPITWDVMTGR